MTDCCESSPVKPKKVTCPRCQALSASVPINTLLHHLNNPWKFSKVELNYYFCHDSHCEVIYFSDAENIIIQSDLRTEVGIKQASNNNALVCYCFGVTREMASNPEIKSFVISKTKAKVCDCEIRNPSGRCCLKDFPK